MSNFYDGTATNAVEMAIARHVIKVEQVNEKYCSRLDVDKYINLLAREYLFVSEFNINKFNKNIGLAYEYLKNRNKISININAYRSFRSERRSLEKNNIISTLIEELKAEIA